MSAPAIWYPCMTTPTTQAATGRAASRPGAASARDAALIGIRRSSLHDVQCSRIGAARSRDHGILALGLLQGGGPLALTPAKQRRPERSLTNGRHVIRLLQPQLARRDRS